MAQVEYKQGMTTVWCDGEKVVIKNSMGKHHVEANVDHIFGMGEFKKLEDVKYLEEYDHKKYHGTYELASGYIPKRAKDDLAEKSLPGIKDGDFFE